MGFVYIHPANSSIVTDNRLYKGIDYLDRCMSEVLNQFPECDIIISGDYNARTGSLNDYIINDDNKFIPSLEDMDYPSDTFNLPRKSTDDVYNEYGKELMDICCTFGVHILNGRFQGDKHGAFTCFKDNGASVVDYILCSTNLFERIIDFKVNTRCESDHFPISMTLRSGKRTAPVEIHDQHNSASIPRYRWKNDISNNFNSTLSELLSDFNLNQCMDLLNTNIDFAVNRLTFSLQECARLCGLQLTFSDVKHKNREMWYDKECEELKSRKFNILNDFRLTGDLQYLSRYCQLRNSYRSICVDRRKQYMKNPQLRNLLTAVMTINGFGSNSLHL
jgi:hypothetical protein